LALLGFIIHVMVNPIQKTIKSWVINKFNPWFYNLLLPLVVLLFIAIFRRIRDYGITENRYFVLIIAIWILAMVLFLLLSKKKQLKALKKKAKKQKKRLLSRAEKAEQDMNTAQDLTYEQFAQDFALYKAQEEERNARVKG